MNTAAASKSSVKAKAKDLFDSIFNGENRGN